MTTSAPISEGDGEVASATIEANAPAPHVVSETDVLIDAIRRGLTADADEPSRTIARDACRAVAIALGAGAGEPSTVIGAGPGIPIGAGAASPVAAIVETLKKMSPDQLLDLAIQRLRAAIPADAAVAPSEPVRFQLVPLPLPSSRPHR